MRQAGVTQELPGTNGVFTTAVFQNVPSGTPVFLADSVEEAQSLEDGELFRLFIEAMFNDSLIFVRLMMRQGHQPKTIDEVRVALRDYRDFKNANQQNQQAV